jgi:hypothetical protein
VKLYKGPWIIGRYTPLYYDGAYKTLIYFIIFLDRRPQGARSSIKVLLISGFLRMIPIPTGSLSLTVDPSAAVVREKLLRKNRSYSRSMLLPVFVLYESV